MLIPPAALSSVPSATLTGRIVVSPALDGVDRSRFIRFQRDVYRARNDLHWIPPLFMERHDFLDPTRNPFFDHAEVTLLLARRGAEVVGRIAAIEDRSYNTFHGTRTAYFGLYESVDDPAVARALFGAARAWARSRGLDTLLGPMNLSTNHEVGLLVEGFEADPYFMMPYNPRSYGELFEASGLVKAKDLFAWERSARTPPPERFQRVADRIRAHDGIRLRSVDPRRFHEEAARIKAVYDAAWERNWGFVPMSEAEFERTARDLRHLLRPGLALIAEDRGEPIGFSLTVPDFNQVLKRLDGRLTRFGLPVGLLASWWWGRRIDRVRLLTLGVKAGWRRRGIDALLMVETIRNVRRLGYSGGEVSWTLEDNDLINRAIEAVGCVRTKRYRVYETPTAGP